MGLSHGYGEIPKESYSIAAIRRAYDFGCTFFDTAEAYGPNLLPENRGRNKQIVGKAAHDFRKGAVLATKLHLNTDEVAAGGLEGVVRAHLAQSLRNLQTDYVDLYYLHRVNPAVPVEDVAEVMGKLIQDGLIRGWGLLQVDVDLIDRAQQVTPLSAVENIYSMVERGVEERVFPYCLQHQIGLVPFSPIASGFLSGKINAATDFSHSDDVRKYVPQLSAENLAANQPVLALLEEYATKKSATKAQISLAWMLHKYPNVVSIPGLKNQERILENLGAWNVELTDEEFRALDASLDRLDIHGHRGFSEYQGGDMANWGRK